MEDHSLPGQLVTNISEPSHGGLNTLVLSLLLASVIVGGFLTSLYR